MLSLPALRATLFAVTLVLAFSPVQAKHQEGANHVEVTPMVGHRFAGGFDDEISGADLELDETGTVGAIVSVFLDDNSLIEVVYSHQETTLEEDGGIFTGTELFDLDVDYLHVGGMYQWDGDRARPFFTATLGATIMDPEPSDLDSETNFSLAMGGGVKVYVNQHIGFRFEGRGYFTFLESSGGVFCRDGQCLVRLEGSGMWQVEFAAGVVIGF